MKVKRILLIEKDDRLCAEIRSALENAGYAVDRTVDVRSGFKKLHQAHPDLIILAREQAVVSRQGPVYLLRQATDVPMIVLGSEEQASEILELGADVCIGRPPDVREIVARVGALLRRQPETNPPGRGAAAGLEELRELPETGGLHLSSTEFRLAACLLRHRGRLLDYSRLLSEVWGAKKVRLDTLHFHIRRLRTKLSREIIGIRGIGYYLA